MKRGRLQCKDIPDASILRFLAELPARVGAHPWPPGRGALPVDDPRCYITSIWPAFPAGVEHRLVLAKMRRLCDRDLVDGCPCGCRGDFKITDQGRALLDRSDQRV